MNISLYPIQQQHLSLLSIIENEEGIISPEIESALSFTAEQFQAQATSVGFVAKDLEHTETVIDIEIKRLQAMKAAITVRREMVRKRLKEAMQQFGVEKITSPTLKISFLKSESVVIDDASLLVFPYKTKMTVVEENIEKAAIKAAIKTGITVPGAHLQTNQNLQVR